MDLNALLDKLADRTLDLYSERLRGASTYYEEREIERVRDEITTAVDAEIEAARKEGNDAGYAEGLADGRAEDR